MELTRSDNDAEGHRADISSTGITDLDMDSLVQCASKLNLQDVANMAMTCRHFRDAAYSDPVWENQGRMCWPPKQISGGKTFHYTGGREAYLARYIAAQKFKFLDPVDFQFHLPAAIISHIFLDDNNVFIAQGPAIHKWKIGITEESPCFIQTIRGHNARITCMRLLPLEGVGAVRNIAEENNKVLVTSSCDHTIRIWGKGRPQRTLRGHSGPVTVLADCLLGDHRAPVLASGGADGTVRLWSMLSSNMRGRSALISTFHGHEQSMIDLAVAEHNSSLLVSISRDCKLRVWDTITGCCVGSTRGPGVPLGMKFKGAICYVAGSSSVTAIDIRTMQTVATVAVQKPDLLAFEMLPSGSTICTGGSDKTAKLWDIRNTCSHEGPEPVAILENHSGPVKLMHIDSNKAVTGGPGDRFVHVWDTKTTDEVISLDCAEGTVSGDVRVGAMAVRGTRIITGTCGELPGIIRFRDFSNCAVPLVAGDQSAENGHKFWETDFCL